MMVDMAFKLNVGAYADGGWIPRVQTCEGADLSPPVEWLGEPAVTESFALILDDPDAPQHRYFLRLDAEAQYMGRHGRK